MGDNPLNIPLRIGLTGGIASGKTTVANLFADLSVPVIDADVIVRDTQRKGQPCYEKIVKLLGRDILDKDGEFRRDHLRKLVFDNPSIKQQLESIIHPEVRRQILEHINKVRYPYCIISIPLLFESDLQKTVDRVLVIDASEKVQISRASKRDRAEPDAIRKIIQTQIDRNARLQQADDIIVNNKDIKHLVPQVEKLNRMYLELAKKNPADFVRK